MCIFSALFILMVPKSFAQEQQPIPDWPDHYNAFELLTYHLEISESNWNIIKDDESKSIEVPALFWATGDEYGYAPDDPILVSVRRKSDLLGDKVSLKIDINEYYGDDGTCTETGGFADPTCVTIWHGLKKLDLENGEGAGVVKEGFAWYLNQLAAQSLNYVGSRTSWVKLQVHFDNRSTVYKGVYVNVQQRDKQFLKNHGLWKGGDVTWFYEYDDPYQPGYEEAPEDENGDPIDSPNFEALYYQPFQECGNCLPQPSEDQFIPELESRINMEGMLTYAAVSAFHISPDDLFSKGKNFFFVDYSDEVMKKREYIQWDLDSVFSGDINQDIYNQAAGYSGGYEDWIIGNLVFREQYNNIMQTLLDGPFKLELLLADLDAFEVMLCDALAEDPYGVDDSTVQEHFDGFRDKLVARYDSVQSQLGIASPATPFVTTEPTPAGTQTLTPSPSDPPSDLGDVNNDGNINIIDALLVAQEYVGLNPPNFINVNADMNCDGSLNIIDALLIAQYFVGLISVFC